MITKEQWERQLAFNERFFKDKLDKSIDELTLEEREEWTQKFLLHLDKEKTEVLDEINFKMHRKHNKKIIRSNILEELIDIQKFNLGLFQLWQFTYEDYIEGFNNKSTVVEQRYRQEHELDLLNPEKPICALDLDGVIFDYPNCFIDWAKKFYFIGDAVTIKQIKEDHGLEIYESMKDAYRQSGAKARLPLKSGIFNFISILKACDYQIIGLTSRPYSKYSRIYYDTLDCLKYHGIELDALFWSDNKCLEIIKSFPNIKFFIDDELRQAAPVAKKGYTTFIMKSTEQVEGEIPEFPTLIQANDFTDVIYHLTELHYI